jgi:hypothetical protein
MATSMELIGAIRRRLNMADCWMETTVQFWASFTAYGRMHPDGTTEWEVHVPGLGRMTEEELSKKFKTVGMFVHFLVEDYADWTPMENEDDGA